jgi:hypothetical protein
VATPAAWTHLGLVAPRDAPFGAADASAEQSLFDDAAEPLTGP